MEGSPICPSDANRLSAEVSSRIDSKNHRDYTGRSYYNRLNRPDGDFLEIVAMM